MTRSESYPTSRLRRAAWQLHLILQALHGLAPGQSKQAMCGIAGIIDLAGKRPAPLGALRAMASALVHRGPDDEGFLSRPGLGLTARRLSIVGLSDGHQPIANEDHTVSVVFNGELFDCPEERVRLEQQGHRFATHCDSELIPHLWEQYRERMLAELHGQFAFALWDEGQRQLVLARDRFGICPLFWTRQRDWLLFASEIKALLASGMVPATADPRGLNHLFTFFALPGPVTCFAGIQALLPGHYLLINLQQSRRLPGGPAAIEDHKYWEMDFPDRGEEESAGKPRQLVDDFEATLLRAVERRLRADVPVVAYLSGGVDSSLVTALASRLLGRPIPTFSIQVHDPSLDESSWVHRVARHLQADPVVIEYGRAETYGTYPALIQAAESPVIDTACAALLLLAREVHAQRYKVALTGEGADEWLAGYPWFKVNRLLGLLDVVPGLSLGRFARRRFLWLSKAPADAWSWLCRDRELVGGDNAWLEIYGLMMLSRLRFFSPELQEQLAGHSPYEDLELNRERMRRWHPLNRGIYLGGRIMLPGLLLQAKGDRVAMHSSVETRYPFLDEEVFAFLSRLQPQWKLHALQDKRLLRLLAERWLPREVAWRPKGMFRAPLEPCFHCSAPAFVDQLLSAESLRRSGYFDAQAVDHWRRAYREMRPGSYQRTSVELGLAGVFATQLWHHTFIDPNLADLPGRVPARAALVS